MFKRPFGERNYLKTSETASGKLTPDDRHKTQLQTQPSEKQEEKKEVKKSRGVKM
jgi:hypothetical protein